MHVTLRSPAKLNLFLHITGRREDGYHNLQTLFQLLDYGDDLEFRIDPDNPRILVTPELEGTPPEENLVFRAATALQDRSSGNAGVRVHIFKNLPMGGGLGGGSSNAGITLVALNYLWNCGLENSELQEIGRQIGADVPLFVLGHSAWAEGTGEELVPVDIPQAWYLVITPQIHVNTGKIFSHGELTRDTPAITIPPSLDWASLEELHNDCEAVTRQEYPEVEAVFQWLEQNVKSGSSPRLTGTGGSVFVHFDDPAEAVNLLDQLPDDYSGFVARGMNSSNTLKNLKHNIAG